MSIAGLNDGLARLGLRLAEVDLHELVGILSNGDPQGLVRWESWQSFFSDGTPSWEDSAAERRRRLTLQRLKQAIGTALRGDTAALVRWFSARDRQRSGRVSLPEFCAGLRANGVILADADVNLAAAEMKETAAACQRESREIDLRLAEREASLVKAKSHMARGGGA